MPLNCTPFNPNFNPKSIAKRGPKPICLLSALEKHLENDELQQAVTLLPILARGGIRPSLHTYATLLHRCIRFKSITLARDVHLYLKITGFKKLIPSHTLLSNHVIGYLFETQQHNEARKLFDKMSARNVFSYNAMISGYAKMGMPLKAKTVFYKMGVGMRDVVSWNTVIIALARGGMWRDSVEFYVKMRKEFWGYNGYTFSGVLFACVRLGQLRLVEQLHGQTLVLGFTTNIVITSSLLDAYAKCQSIDVANGLFNELPNRDIQAWMTLVSGYIKGGDLVMAFKVFNNMPSKNLVSWSAMISGCVHCGRLVEALEMFRRMIGEGVQPDQFVISSGLCACASVASIKHGKQIHAYLIRRHFQPNVVVLSALIDMYSKCGDLEVSRRIFNGMPYYKRDTVLWNTMISAYGRNGRGLVAVELFKEMIRTGTVPNSNTFVSILTACSHSGLVAEGVHIFNSMSEDHCIIPNEEHQACFVDLLGRAGLLNEAKDWILKFPSRSNVLVWKALLGACRIHGNVEIGKEAAERLMELEPLLSASYVQLSNMYNDAGKWESAEKVRHLMNNRNVRKEQGVSSFGINNAIHSFETPDHPHKR